MAPLDPFASLYIPSSAAPAPPPPPPPPPPLPSAHIFHRYCAPPPPPPVCSFVTNKNYLQLLPINSRPLYLNPFFSFRRNMITCLQIYQQPNYNFYISYPRPHLNNSLPLKQEHGHEFSGCFYGSYNMPRALPPMAMPMSFPSVYMHPEEPYRTRAPPLSEEMTCIIKEVVEEEGPQQQQQQKEIPDHSGVKQAIIKSNIINKSERTCWRRKNQGEKMRSVDDDHQYHQQQHHPQQQQQEEEEVEEYSVSESLWSKTSPTTTLMIRNIPNKFDKKRVLDVLDNHCRKVNEKAHAAARDQGADDADACSEFDFFYLPMDFGTGCNYGYAFVNFTTQAAAQRLYAHLHRRSWGIRNSRKICEVTKAKIQGLDALLRHFRVSTFICENGDYRPTYFVPSRNGIRLTNQQYIGRHILPWGAAAAAAAAANADS